jgi:hypothetical protein
LLLLEIGAFEAGFDEVFGLSLLLEDLLEVLPEFEPSFLLLSAN